MKKSKILSLILCAVLVIAFASLDASAASTYIMTGKDGETDLTPKSAALTSTTITAEENEEKEAGDKYYKITSNSTGDQNIFEAKLGTATGARGDHFISFDFKGDKFSYFSIKGTAIQENGEVGWTIEKDDGTSAYTGYKVAELFRISPTTGIYEAGSSIVGDFKKNNEIFVPASKIRKNGWNSVQVEVCCAKKQITVTLNGDSYTLDAAGEFTDSNGFKTWIKNGFYALCMYVNISDVTTGEVLIDNIYIQGHMDTDCDALDEKFTQTDTSTGEHYGHLGSVSDHAIATPYLIEKAYGFDARNGWLTHTEKNASTKVAADVKHIYVKPNATAADAITNITKATGVPETDNVRLYKDATLADELTENATLPDECIAVLPLRDGKGTGRIRSYVEYSVGAGPFEFGMAQMNNVGNTYYSVLGFNPTIEDPATLYLDQKLVIPDSFGGMNVNGVGDYAFYKGAPAFATEVTYPNIDFDLSKVVSSGRCWTGECSFKKTGITEVIFSKQAYPQYNSFDDCDKLEYVDLTNVFGGQADAFANCDNLKTVKAENIESWTWGGGVATFANCPKLTEMTFNTVNTTKPWIDYRILDKASSLKTIKVMDAAGSGVKYLDNNVTLYAAAYDSTGKMVGISVLKKLDESHNYKTLTIPEGAHVKIFNIKKDGSLAPSYYYDSAKKTYSYQPAITLK